MLGDVVVVEARWLLTAGPDGSHDLLSRSACLVDDHSCSVLLFSPRLVTLEGVFTVLQPHDADPSRS